MPIDNPTDIANLELWLDASDINSLWQDSGKTIPITADGQTVGAWEDKSGNGNDVTQGTAANEPTYKESIYNSRSILRFDGINDYLLSGAIAGLDSISTLTWFTVFKIDDFGASAVVIRSKYNAGAGAQSTNIWGGFFTSSTNTYYEYARKSDGTIVAALAPLATNLTVSCGRWNADNSVAGWRYGSYGQVTSATANAAPTTHVRTVIGGDSITLGNLPWDGDIAEVIVYTDDLSDTDRKDVEKYLCEKWGVLHMETTSNLSKYSGVSPDWYGRSDMIDNDGTWVHVYRTAAGHGHDSGAQFHIRFSEDGGDTWTDEDIFTDSGPVTGFPINEHSTNAVADACLIRADNGDLIILLGEINASDDIVGTWLYTSSDDGETWSDDGQINSDSELYLAGGDHIIQGGDIYVSGWKDPTGGNPPYKSVLYKSPDNGATWASVSDITSTAEGSNESSIIELGNNTLLTVLRDDSQAATYKRISTNLGVSWGSLTDIVTQVSVVNRPKLRVFNEYPGYIFLIGRIYVGSGIHYTGILYSIDNGVTWIGPYFPDNTVYEDAGYCDMLSTPAGLYMFSYGGTQADADIYEYKIALIPIPRVIGPFPTFFRVP